MSKLEDPRVLEEHKHHHTSWDTAHLHAEGWKDAIIIDEADVGQACAQCGKCTGFVMHKWRHTCFMCRCPRIKHTICNKRNVNIRARLGLPEPEEKAMSFNRHASVSAGFTWIPPGLEIEQLKQYFGRLNPEEIPKIGTAGEKYRDLQIITQWPRHDLDVKYCRRMQTSAEKDQFKKMRYDIVRNGDFDVGFAQICPKRGMICAGCKLNLKASEVVVSAPKLNVMAWHPDCFKCTTCEEPLIDLAYAVKDNKIYCGRHFGEKLKQRCGGCDELIMGARVEKTDDGMFHEDHHNCTKCEKKLDAYRVINQAHYCDDCFLEQTGTPCFKCKKVIQDGEVTLEDQGQTYHVKCFACDDCRKPIDKKKFTRRGHKKICTDCIEKRKPKLCGKCCGRIEGDAIKFDGKLFCDGCFSCAECRMPLSETAYKRDEDHLCCMACYERSHSKTCSECRELISAGSRIVTHESKNYHPKCFACTKCHGELEKRFTICDGKRYCKACAAKI